MSSPYRCSTRILKDLRRISRSVIFSKRAFSQSSYWRGGDFQPNTYSIRRVDAGARPAYLDPATRSEGNVDYVKIAPWDPIHPAYLRDSCKCEKCVDPSSKQKNFQTTDIPKDIKAGCVKISPDDGSVEITWENDIPGFEAHKSYFSREFFDVHSTPYTLAKSRFQNGKPSLWNKKTITRELEYVNYDEYMNTDEGLFRAVRQVSNRSSVLNNYSFYAAAFIRSAARTRGPSIRKIGRGPSTSDRQPT